MNNGLDDFLSREFKKMIPPKYLERVLEPLPEPNVMAVCLVNYDGNIGTEISSSLQEALPSFASATLEISVKARAIVEKPTKKQALEIYRSSYGKDQLGHPEFCKPRVELAKILWQVEEEPGFLKAFIVMSPKHGFLIKYWGPEPEYIAQMQQVLSDTPVEMEIHVNKTYCTSDFLWPKNE